MRCVFRSPGGQLFTGPFSVEATAVGGEERTAPARRVRAGPCWPRRDAGGEYAWRVRGEEHMWTPDAIAKLQRSTRSNSYTTYREYAQIINDQSKRHMTFRGLFEFKFDQCAPVPIEEVESAAEIVKRFATGAMSLGSISTEAHTTLAIAMNRIGGKSNTGEGGEDYRRYAPVKAGESLMSRLGRERVEVDIPLVAGDSLKSKIKQVASGRFGVTADIWCPPRCSNQDRTGGEPGEGGQLPGRKVSAYIAELRYATPERTDLSAAASRHLLHRRHRPAHPRPEKR